MRTLLSLLLLVSIAFAGDTVRSRDITGKQVSVPVTGKPTVVFFVGVDCPISNRMAPELLRIVAAYPKVEFFFVYADKAAKIKSVEDHLHSFNLPGPAILDSKLSVAKFAKATVTPEAALFNASGKLVYHGRINDTYVEHNRPSSKTAKNDLRDAITAMLAGRTIDPSYIAPVGCRIPF
jgi:thiol-disulfide isomerase/thioredoxin